MQSEKKLFILTMTQNQILIYARMNQTVSIFDRGNFIDDFIFFFKSKCLSMNHIVYKNEHQKN